MTPLPTSTPCYRVSTQKQGISGSGLAAQQAAVRAFVTYPAQLLTEYVEGESGKQSQWPQLLAAMAEARQVGSTLLIAKLDRLSRNASFILALRDSGVDFVCRDLPDANSKRTKDALAAKKARGFQLGNPQNMTPAIKQQGQAAMQRNTREHPANQQAALLADLLRAQGQTLWQIANRLNAVGYRTRQGGAFHATTVQRRLAAGPVSSQLIYQMTHFFRTYAKGVT